MHGKLEDRIGEKNTNTLGYEMIVSRYKNARDIDVFFPKYNWTFYKTTYDCFKKGNIKCPYEPRTYGKGYVGEGIYKPKVNGKPTKHYELRNKMLFRCYSKNTTPTYTGCEVCDEWLNFQNFAKWVDGNYYEIPNETMCLDKDILVKGNKIYSPETCIFAPNEINNLFTKRQLDRGNYPIGVNYYKANRKYTARVNKRNERPYLGLYDTPEEAFEVYKKVKEDYIKEVADLYKDKIPKNYMKLCINTK